MRTISDTELRSLLASIDAADEAAQDSDSASVQRALQRARAALTTVTRRTACPWCGFIVNWMLWSSDEGARDRAYCERNPRRANAAIWSKVSPQLWCGWSGEVERVDGEIRLAIEERPDVVARRERDIAEIERMRFEVKL